MWAIAGILVISIMIMIKEVPTLLRKRLKKELWVFFILLLIGTGLGIALGLQLRIPNPLDWIAFFYKPLSDVIYGFFR